MACLKTKVNNSDLWFNHPIDCHIELYDQAVKEYISLVSGFPEVIAILQIGNVGVAGISDIDLVVILDDNYTCLNNYSFYQISDVFHNLLMHDVFIIPYTISSDIRLIAPVFDMKVVYKNDLNIIDFKIEPNFYEKFVLLADLMGTSVNKEYDRWYCEKLKDVKLIIARLNALKYPIYMIKDLCMSSDINILSNHNILFDNYVNDFSTFRKNWFTEIDSIKISNLDLYIHEATKIISPLINHYWVLLIKKNFKNFQFDCEILSNLKEFDTVLSLSSCMNLPIYAMSCGRVSNQIDLSYKISNINSYNLSTDYTDVAEARIKLINCASHFREKNNIPYGALWEFNCNEKSNLISNIKILIKNMILTIISKFIKYV